MKLSKLLQYIQFSYVGYSDPEVTGLSIVADKVQAGDVFVALSGSKKDGVTFVPEAIQNGAVAVLSERDVQADVPVIVIPNLRCAVSKMAAVLYPSDSLVKVAVTGTNGKTSTVFYVQQLLNKLGICTASVGTIGVDSPVLTQVGSMTTPDAVTLNKTLHELSEKGVRVVALEASSHGLDQGRLDGLSFAAGAFTNLTQDHLDYHKTMDAYLQTKSLLFTEVVSEKGIAVLNADVPAFDMLKGYAEKRGQKIISYGWNGSDFQLLKQDPTKNGQKIVFRAFGQEHSVELNIVGDFQVMNIFAAMGLCIGAGADVASLIQLLPELKAPSGRIELMGTLPNGASVFVDYAHTPDAVERVLISLRPHTKGKLICLLGCGGNRDKTKRPLMGALAAKLADVVYVTDDNPRFENPADIRSEILVACPGAIECDNREKAIHQAIASLDAGDVLVLAGKGHETGQTIGDITYALDDRVEARLALLKKTQEPIWEAIDLRLALSAEVSDLVAGYGVSIDTRTLKLGDIFIALTGEKTNGHDFVRQAVMLGASACIVDHLIEGIPTAKQIVVNNTMVALEALARFARMRSSARFIGVTGSSGKTTTKEMLKACLSKQGITHATIGNFNNQIGVPLTLARMPLDTQYAIVEMGMNHTGELIRLSDMVRPDVSIITMIGAAHRAFFASNKDIAAAKAEIFEYQNRQGTVVLNRDDVFFDFLKESAEQQGIQKIISFGENKQSDFILTGIALKDTGMTVFFAHKEQSQSFDMKFIGKHFAMNALGVLAIVAAVGGDVAMAMSALETVEPAMGRGACMPIQLDENRQILLIDDAYNANPASMAASIRSLGLRTGGRKIAVLGDMLELGKESVEMHQALMPVLTEAGIDKVYTAGELMQSLFSILPTYMQGGTTQDSVDLIPILKKELQDGDIVLVKSSHGSKMNLIVEALKGVKK